MQPSLSDVNFVKLSLFIRRFFNSENSRTVTAKVVLSVVVTWLSLVLCGCSNLQPRPPATLMKPFEVQFKQKLGDDASKASLLQLRQGISAFNDELLNQLSTQNNIAWTYNDITFFGVIGTFAGAAADKIGLRNAGAGAATLGTTLPAHYQVEPTFQAYLKAMRRASCTESRIAGLPTNLESLFDALETNSGDADALLAVLTAYQNLHSDVYGTLNVIRLDLVTSILTSRPTDMSVSDISGTFAKFKNISLKSPEVNAANLAGKELVKQLRADASLQLTDMRLVVQIEQSKLLDLETKRRGIETEFVATRQVLAETQKIADAASKATVTANNPSLNLTQEQLNLKDAEENAARVSAELEFAMVKEREQRQALRTASNRLRSAEKVDSAAKASSVEEAARDLRAAMEQVKGLAGALELCSKL